MQNVFQKVTHKPFYSPLSALDSIYSIFQYSLKRIKYTWKKRERESVKVPPVGLLGASVVATQTEDTTYYLKESAILSQTVQYASFNF